MPFGSKFGASFDESCKLIQRCKELGANLIGVSFHVGSGCYSSQAWHDAIRLARRVFDAAQEAGYKMTLLDIGGVRLPSFLHCSFLDDEKLSPWRTESLLMIFDAT
jgi:diaminopimelate decarboxylase